MAHGHDDGDAINPRMVQTQRLFWIAAYIGCATLVFVKVGIDIHNQPVAEPVEAEDASGLRPKPELYGLRGMIFDAPSDTIPSFQLAKDAWADGVSLDVWSAGDGVPVVIEDPDLSKSTNGHGYVWDRDSSYINELDGGSKFSQKFAGTKVLMFEEAVAWAKANDCSLFVEIRESGKENPNLQTFVGRIVGIISEAGMTFQTRVSSANLKVLVTIKQIAPALSVGIQVDSLVGGVTLEVAKNRFVHLSSSAAATATPNPTTTSGHGSSAGGNKTENVYAHGMWDFVSMYYPLIQKNTIPEIREGGKHFFVYRMPDDVESIINFLKLGADGLVTRYVKEVQRGWYRVSSEGVRVFERSQ